MRKNITMGILLCCALIVGVGFTGCTSGQNEKDEGFYAYYLSTEKSALIQKEIEPPEQTDTQKLLAECKERINSEPDQQNVQRLLSEDVQLKVGELKERMLSIDLSAEYEKISRTEEILVRAGIVKTFCQVPGIDSVLFHVNGAPLKDAYGEEIGPLAAEDFVENSGTDTSSYEKRRLTLYFTNAEGTALVREERNVYYNRNVPLETVVMTQLIKGPSSDKSYPALPSDVKVIDISITQGDCYVSFDQSFITQARAIPGEITIYSVVNSLVDNCGVRQVRISVDGKSDQTFREDVNLADVFKKNEELVE